MAQETLAKSSSDKIVAGVLGGIAAKQGWDPTVTRVVYVVLTLITGIVLGLLVYLIMALVMD